MERVRAELRELLSDPDRVQVAALPDGVILRGEMQESEVEHVIDRVKALEGVDRVDDRTRHLGVETAADQQEMPVVR